jgi:hypothetical protein
MVPGPLFDARIGPMWESMLSSRGFEEERAAFQEVSALLMFDKSSWWPQNAVGKVDGIQLLRCVLGIGVATR